MRVVSVGIGAVVLRKGARMMYELHIIHMEDSMPGDDKGGSGDD